MSRTKTPLQRSSRLNLRTTEQQKRLFERVAGRQGTTVTAFVLDSAYRKAQEVLSDERHYAISADQWERFVAALQRPARVKARLKRLFTEPTVLEP